jgi:transaldolase
MSRVKAIARLGQQVWLDNLSRGLLASGALARLIEEDGLAGVTSNPAIFHKAFESDPEYREALNKQGGTPLLAEERFERIALEDIRRACDLFRPLYETSGGSAGLVSFEVAPRLAHDSAGTAAAVRRLWQAIGRPNAMLKIPATAEGLAAIEECIAEGININVTLIFSLRQLAAVQAAHRRGLERRLAAGREVSRIVSVASMFVSRIDTAVDARLPESAASLRGRAAIALAKLAYRAWQRQPHLSAGGARPQRLLWGSTSTKNPAYRDVMYVEQLIGPDTINTMPDATLDAFRDHGNARLTLTEGVDQAQEVVARLAQLGIDLEQVGAELQDAGVKAFDDAFHRLLALFERDRDQGG